MPQTRLDAFKSVVDSHFFALFEQDRVPSSQERNTIQALLADRTAHLAHLNSQVPKRRGKKLRRELRIELDNTRRSIKFHRALISPWRRLPVEILSEIFLFTLVPIESKGGLWNDDRDGTLLLCKICSTWRAIALRTPALWNVLSLRPKSLQRPLDWASNWLDRAQSFPVYLQTSWGVTAHQDVINAVISIFASHVHHTAALWIVGVGDSGQPSFPLPDPYDARLLSSLCVHLPPGSSWDWIHAACQTSSRLTNLAISHFSFDWFPANNLRQLTELELLAPMSMSTAFQLLENASSLEVFYIEVEGPGVARSSVLVMKSVSTIEIACSDGEHLGQFLKQLEFPCLTSMAFREVVSAWPERECHSFLSRSSCALRSLELINVRTPQDHIIACLQHKACATLEWLHTNMSPTDALLQHLTYRGHPFPNPKLRTIKLENIRAADGLLSALVESRLFLSTTVTGLPPGVPVPAWLRKVWFTFVEGLAESQYVTHKEDWEGLREIKMKALDIDLNVEIVWSDESGTVVEVVS